MRLGPPEGSFFDIFLKIAQKNLKKIFRLFFHKYALKSCIYQIYPTLYKFTSIIVGQN